MHIHRHDVHLCLVSQQATPNFIPVLDHRFRPKRVILVVSPDMRERARWLESALTQRSVAVEQYLIADAWDIPRIQDELLRLLVRESDNALALNVTGGTKPMAIAAQEVFRAEGKPIFYVHPERDEVIPLFCDEQPFPIEQRVKIPDYLSIHGFHEVQRDRREFREACYLLGREWVMEVERLGKPLGTLNFLAGTCRQTRHVVAPDHKKEPHVWELIDKLREHGLAETDRTNLVFPDEQSRFFVNGGWLELYVDQTVRDLGELKVQDVARSLRVESAGHARNELDIAVLARNRLCLIECKTRGMESRGYGTPGPDALYKLDSLTALGGLNTRGMIVSYRPLEKQDRQRAADLSIRVVEGGQLRNLSVHLMDWMMA